MGTGDFNFLDKIIARVRLNKVIQYIDKNDVVLDFGCGKQAYFLKLAKTKINYGFGLDYDTQNFIIDNKVKLIKFKFKTKLPFKNNFFDKIFLLAVIEHFYQFDLERLMKEIYRVLKINGKVIITTPTPKSKSLLEFLAYKLKIISALEIRDHKKYYDKKSLLVFAKKTNFRLSRYYKFLLGLNSLCIFDKK